MRKKNTVTGLSLSNFSQQHSWIFYVRGVRETSGRAANSENDMIFWEVVERSTASPEKVITVGPGGTIALAHWEGFSSVTTAWSRVLQRQMGLHSNNPRMSAGRQSHPQTMADPQTPLPCKTGNWNHSDPPQRQPTMPLWCLPFSPSQLGPPLSLLVPIVLGNGPELVNETSWCASTLEKQPSKPKQYAIATS